MQLWHKNCMISIFWNVLRLVLWPNMSSIWRLYHVHLIGICLLLPLSRSFYRCLVCLIALKVFHFLVGLQSNCSIHYWEWGIGVFKYYCWIVYFSLQFCPFLLHEALLGIYIFIMIISSWCIDPFIILKCYLLY